MDCLSHKCYGPIRVFFWASYSWQPDRLFDQSFSIAPHPFRHLRCSLVWDPSLLFGASGTKGAPCVGSYSVVQCISYYMGHSLYCSAANSGMWGKRGYSDGSNPYTWLCSIVLLPWLPGFPPPAFPTMISSFASPQSISLQSTVAFALWLLHNPWTPAPSHWTFQGTLIPIWAMYGCGKDCLILIPFRPPQISCFNLSLKCSSPDCPDVGIGPLLYFPTPALFPHPLRAGPVLLTLLLFPLVPSSYQVLRGSVYSFPLVRYACPLSADVLHAVLCLQVYSWCIRGERCTPRPPTPLPSYSLLPPIFLRRSLIFPLLLFSSTFIHCLSKKAFLCFLASLWNSAFSWMHVSLSPLLFTSFFSFL